MLLALVIIESILIIFLTIALLRGKKQEKETSLKELDTSAIGIKEKYMFRQEVKMLRILNQILPSKYLTLPKVSLSCLLEPRGSKLVYNKLATTCVDFVVFEEATMAPVLIVDIYDNSFSDEALLEQEPFLNDILEKIKLPCLAYQLKGEINKDEVKKLIEKSLKLEEEKIDSKN